MADLTAYLGLIASVFAIFILLMRTYILVVVRKQISDHKFQKEVLLSYAFSMLFLCLFALMGSSGWLISILARIPPFSIDIYREYAPAMVIIACIIVYSALRFKHRFIVAGIYLSAMVVSLLLYGIWRANYYNFYYLDWEVFRIALGYTSNATIQAFLLCVAAFVLIALTVLFKIPKRISESLDEAVPRNHNTRLVVASVLMAAFALAMLDSINTSLIAVDPPNNFLWGGTQLTAVANDGGHVYYSQSHGADERVDSGHRPVFKLYCASLQDNKPIEIPQPIAMTGGFPSPTGKYLLGNDKGLIVIDSKTYKIINRIRTNSMNTAEVSYYGWMGSDDEIWYFDESAKTVIIRNFRSGATRRTDISQPLGVSWSKDCKYALWLENFEYCDPNAIFVYDREKDQSIKVATAGNNQDEISCAAFSNDDGCVYYVLSSKKGAKSNLYLRAVKIVNHKDSLVTSIRSLSSISRLEPTLDGKRLLYEGYLDRSYLDKSDGNQFTGGEHFIFVVDLTTGKRKELVHNSKYGFSWDYCSKNNKLVWNDDFRPEFKAKVLD